MIMWHEGDATLQTSRSKRMQTLYQLCATESDNGTMRFKCASLTDSLVFKLLHRLWDNDV